MSVATCSRASSWLLRTIGFAAVVLGGIANPLAAQRSQRSRPPLAESVVLRGMVVRQDSVTPAPYSTVELVEAHARHFTDADGKFSFKAPPGRYHLLVRQLGFAARDSVITLSKDVVPSVVVVPLTALVLKLSEVKVRAQQTCMIPGVDSMDEPILFGFVSQVRENARRELLLRRAYPFEYTVEDVQTSHAVTGSPPASPSVETLAYRSDAMMPYSRGGIVFTDRTDPRGAWERMRLPSTVDFADSNFMATHCFDYGVAESGNYNINFRPLAAITTPDVEGTVTLDSLTFVLRSAVIRLTRPAAVAPGFERLEVNTTYREVLPRVALADRISSNQRYRAIGPDASTFIATEVQTMRTLRFLTHTPSGAAREQVFGAAASAMRATASVPDRQ